MPEATAGLAGVFYWLFNMSLLGAVAGLPVLLLRRIRRIPARLRIWLWAAPFLRLTVPFGLRCPVGISALLRPLVRAVPGRLPAFDMMNFVQAAEGYAPLVFADPRAARLFGVAGLIWSIGTAAILLTLLAVYIATMRELADARPIGGGVFVSDKVTGPAVYGIFRPRIVLPPDSGTPQQRGYILAHERAHIRRADGIWRLCAVAAAAVHWFDPFVWLYLRLFLHDLELACDESATARLSPDERRAYARTLLDCADRQRGFAVYLPGYLPGGAPFCRRRTRLRARIESLLAPRRVTAVSAVCFSLLIAAVVFLLLTNA